LSWLSRFLFGPGGGAAPLAAASGTLVPTSPWAEPTVGVHTWVVSDIYGVALDTVDRERAMKVPPVKRGRDLIVGSLADLPMQAGRWEGGDFTPVDRQPSWLTYTKNVQTAWHRMANTLDDLIFSGWSLWALDRSETGTILDAVRVSPNRWGFDDRSPTGITLDGEPLTDPSRVILFQGPNEGLLATGAEVVRSWHALGRARLGKARNPIPMTVLQETEHNGATNEEAEAFVTAWSNARKGDDGAIGFLPAGMVMKTFGDVKPELYEQAFNALRLDVANFLNLPASLLDGSTATASLTYVTQEGQRSALGDYLELYLAPIEARLSQDDVVPHGQAVRFNRSNLTNVPNDPHGAEAEPEQPAIEAAAAPELEASND
jgi:hypothetical protein